MSDSDPGHLLDLGMGDVHVPGAGKAAPAKSASKASRKKLRAKAKKRTGIMVHANIAPGGHLHVRHLRDNEEMAYLPPVAIATDPEA